MTPFIIKYFFTLVNTAGETSKKMLGKVEKSRKNINILLKYLTFFLYYVKIKRKDPAPRQKFFILYMPTREV